MSKRGVDILFYIQDKTTPGTWNLVGGQRGATLSEENETIETTNKTTGGAKEYEYGFYGWSVSCEGVHEKDDVGYKQIKDALRNKETVLCRIDDSGDKLEGTALVTSAELDAPHDGEATYSVEFQGTGELTSTTGA